MKSTSLASLGFVLGVCGCVGSKSSAEDPVVAVPPPAPTAHADDKTPAPAPAKTGEAPAEAPAIPASVAEAPPVEDAKRPLGSACTRARVAGKIDVCGSRGRVSLEVDRSTVSHLRAGGCEPRELGRQTMYIPAACATNDHLVAGSTCFACRLMGAGWSIRALVDELSDEQALDLQRRLGLDASAALRGKDAWNRAIDARARSVKQ
ncbi:MAG: hypothetical protein U0263_20780 [Polyangiaceae bacterium]